MGAIAIFSFICMVVGFVQTIYEKGIEDGCSGNSEKNEVKARKLMI